MSPRHFSHELRRVARESYAPATVPSVVVLFCLGVWHFLWLSREPDPSLMPSITGSQRVVLNFFDAWWPYLGWVFPFLIVKRLDTEAPAGIQRTLPLTRGELLAAKLTFVFLATVALPAALFAGAYAVIHPETLLEQTWTVFATQWLLACLGAAAALMAAGWRGVVWLGGLLAAGAYFSDVFAGVAHGVFGRRSSPVFDDTFAAYVADGSACALRYGLLLIAPVAVVWLALRSRQACAAWLFAVISVALFTTAAIRFADAPRYPFAVISEIATLTPLSRAEAKSVAKDQRFKVINGIGPERPLVKASVVLNAPGLVPDLGKYGGAPGEILLGFSHDGRRNIQVGGRMDSGVMAYSFAPRKEWNLVKTIADIDHGDRIVRLIAAGLFPEHVRFWRMGPDVTKNDWQPVSPLPEEVRLNLTISGKPDRTVMDGGIVAVPFVRYAAPEILLRAPVKQGGILRLRDLVIRVCHVSCNRGDLSEGGSNGFLNINIAMVARSGPFRVFGDEKSIIGFGSPFSMLIFNPVKKQAIIVPMDTVIGSASLYHSCSTGLSNHESPNVNEAWLNESEIMVVRLREIERIKRFVTLRRDDASSR